MDFSPGKYQGLPESQLQHAYHSGDALALEELWLRHERYFVAVAHKENRYLSDEAVAELTVRLADPVTQNRYQPQQSWRHYAIGILRHVLSEMWRKWHRRQTSSDEVLQTYPSSQALPAEVAEQKEIKAAMDRCLDKLPPDLRRVLLLYFVEDQRVEDIARACGITNGTVSKRKERALLAIRRCLEQRAQ